MWPGSQISHGSHRISSRPNGESKLTLWRSHQFGYKGHNVICLCFPHKKDASSFLFCVIDISVHVHKSIQSKTTWDDQLTAPYVRQHLTVTNRGRSGGVCGILCNIWVIQWNLWSNHPITIPCSHIHFHLHSEKLHVTKGKVPQIAILLWLQSCNHIVFLGILSISAYVCFRTANIKAALNWTLDNWLYWSRVTTLLSYHFESLQEFFNILCGNTTVLVVRDEQIIGRSHNNVGFFSSHYCILYNSTIFIHLSLWFPMIFTALQ